MTIDYQKAFNRMEHDHCISMLARKGASNQSLQMVASFLEQRKMRFKVGNVMSAPYSTPGGAPQGTRSGNFLFTMTIDDVGNARLRENDRYKCSDYPLLERLLAAKNIYIRS